MTSDSHGSGYAPLPLNFSSYTDSEDEIVEDNNRRPRRPNQRDRDISFISRGSDHGISVSFFDSIYFVSYVCCDNTCLSVTNMIPFVNQVLDYILYKYIVHSGFLSLCRIPTMSW